MGLRHKQKQTRRVTTSIASRSWSTGLRAGALVLTSSLSRQIVSIKANSDGKTIRMRFTKMGRTSECDLGFVPLGGQERAGPKSERVVLREYVIEYASGVSNWRVGESSGVSLGKNILVWRRESGGTLKIWRSISMYD